MKPAYARTLRSLQRNILAGIITIGPLFVTYLIFSFLLGILAKVGYPIVWLLAAVFPGNLISQPWVQSSMGIVLTLVVLYAVGRVMSQVVGRQALRLFEKALERLMLPYRYGGNGGTTLYDSVYLCSNLVTKKQTGRKALVLLTDGDDHGSRTTVQAAIEAAQRADTLIYSILFSDDSFGGRFGGDGKGILQKMSRETGGGFFEVSKKHPLDAIYRQLQE